MKSLGSCGEVRPGVSRGVRGKAEEVEEAGAGLVGYGFGGAIGKVKESLFVLREVVEADRDERVSIKSSPYDWGELMGSSGRRRGLVSSQLPSRAGCRRSGVEAPFRIVSSMLLWSRTISSILLTGCGIGGVAQ